LLNDVPAFAVKSVGARVEATVVAVRTSLLEVVNVASV
jgi:hypothetical protein